MKFFITDVFGKGPYTGNQLATFFDFGALPGSEMQKIAREVNFSETTFITSPEKSNGGYDVRIFTPVNEIGFAGHPTLGTAFIINNHILKNPENKILLNYQVGQIPVTVEIDTLWMKQNQPEFGRETDKQLMAQTLGLEISEIDYRLPVMELSTGLPFTIVPLKTMKALKKAKVNLLKLEEFIRHAWAKEILVFSTETYEPHHSLSTRVFVEYLGIPEDPATGSATGCLAAYLLKYDVFGTCKIDISAGQGYEVGRPSELKIKAELKDGVYDINIGGSVTEIAEGEWKIR